MSRVILVEVGFLIFSSLFLFAICWSDLLHRRIYLWHVIVLGIGSVIYHVLQKDLSIFQMTCGMGLGAVFFGSQFLFSRGRILGSGDVYLAMALGILFGWSSFWFVILVAYVGGVILSFILIGAKVVKRTDPLPLGTFLCIASMVTLFFPQPWALFGVS